MRPNEVADVVFIISKLLQIANYRLRSFQQCL